MPPKNAELFVGDSRDRDRLVIGEGPAFMKVGYPSLLACFRLTSSIAFVLINPDVLTLSIKPRGFSSRLEGKRGQKWCL